MLSLTDITWSTPDGKRVLKGVGFSLEAGESIWLSGPSGGGKSTVLRIINRLLEPAALLTQTPVMLPGSVADNLAAPFKLKAAAGKSQPPPKRMEQSLARAGLDGFGLEQQAGPLSVGQKQRVALARVLLMEPRLLLLDEPISALDPESARKVVEAAAGFARQGGAVLLVSHQEPEFPCRRLVLARGKVTEASQ